VSSHGRSAAKTGRPSVTSSSGTSRKKRIRGLHG
jgi:hypothetical protein